MRKYLLRYTSRCRYLRRLSFPISFFNLFLKFIDDVVIGLRMVINDDEMKGDWLIECV